MLAVEDPDFGNVIFSILRQSSGFCEIPHRRLNSSAVVLFALTQIAVSMLGGSNYGIGEVILVFGGRNSGFR